MYESYTARENRRRAWLTVKATRRAISGAPMDDLEQPAARLRHRAEIRGADEVAAAEAEWRSARAAYSAAQAQWRTAKGPDRPAAKAAVREAKKRLDRAEYAAKRFGLT